MNSGLEPPQTSLARSLAAVDLRIDRSHFKIVGLETRSEAPGHTGPPYLLSSATAPYKSGAATLAAVDLRIDRSHFKVVG